MPRVPCLVVLLIGWTAAQADQFLIDFRLGKGDQKGSRAAGTMKIVAAPTIAAEDEKSTSLRGGGHMPIGGEMVRGGTGVGVTPTAVTGGGVKVRVVLKVHS